MTQHSEVAKKISLLAEDIDLSELLQAIESNIVDLSELLESPRKKRAQEDESSSASKSFVPNKINIDDTSLFTNTM